LGKTLLSQLIFLANLKLKKPTALKKTMYLKHLDLASNQLAQFHLNQ
jgi:hypothetical protein